MFDNYAFKQSLSSVSLLLPCPGSRGRRALTGKEVYNHKFQERVRTSLKIQWEEFQETLFYKVKMERTKTSVHI